MKKIFFALLSAVMFFSACQEEPFVKLSEDATVLEYKAGTVEVTVDALGSWTVDGNYDWITPSATSGTSGEKLVFTYATNLTGSIRNASYTIACDGATAIFTISQKSGSVDAVVALNLGVMNDEKVEFLVDVATANPDDYSEYGVIVSTTDKVADGKKYVGGTTVSAGTSAVNVTGLDLTKDYYAWGYVTSVLPSDVVSTDLKAVKFPVFVKAGADLQAAIDAAQPYDEIRIENATFTGNFTAKDNITISGGWKSDFSAKDGYTTLDGNRTGTVLTLPHNSVGITVEGLKITKGLAADGAGIQANGKAVIKNCWFEDNYGTHRGGAIGSEPDGALDPEGAEITVANCVFTKNASKEHGCAICIDYNMHATYVSNLFHDNYTAQNDEWHIIVTYAGGAFINNTFVNNHMTSGTGYAHFSARHAGSSRSTWDLIIVNNIFVGNDSKEIDHTLEPGEFPSFEGSIRSERQCKAASENWNDDRMECVFESNLVENYIDNYANFKYNPVNTIIPLNSDLTGIFTNFGSDYTLKAGSQAVDAGSDLNEYVKSVLNTYNKDLAGNPRVAGGKVDLGCYELQ